MIESILAGLANPGQPQATFLALDHALQGLVGHRLFTLLLLDGEEVGAGLFDLTRQIPRVRPQTDGADALGQPRA